VNRIKEFFALNKSMYVMIAMVILVGMGERMAERFLPLYVLAVGGTTVAVGMLNAMTNFLGAIYAFPGGWLSDRIGYRKSLMVFDACAMLGYLIVILFPVWQAVFVGAVFFIAWSSVTLPAVMSLVSSAVKREKRTMGVTVNSFVRRIPMALGPLLGGWLIVSYGDVRGVRIGFICAFILGAAAMWMLYRYLPDEKPAKSDGESDGLWDSFKNINAPLKNLLVSDILIRFAEQIPYAFIVLWVVQVCGVSASAFGVLSMIEMVTAMLVYIPVAYFADRYGKKPFVLMTFVFFTAFPLVLYFSRTFWALAFAFVVRGLKEFGEPTRKALIMELAPEGKKASTFGAYYLIRDLLTAAAALTSAWLWNKSPFANFFTAFACGALGTALYAVWGRDVEMPGKTA